MLFVPHAATGLQGGVIDGDGTPMPGPRLQQRHPVPATVANQPWQARRQGRQKAHPHAADGKTPMLAQQRASLAWQGIRLIEKRQHGIRRIETTNTHDDQRLHEEPIGIGLGPATRPLGWLGGHGDPINEQHKANK
jgi:hypothetical protein